jgi:putative AbiEii toxin of type IV toxin-antitoxin system/AAA ATPase-like protein
MKLVEARVSLFRNIVDSTMVPIQQDITCFVGKNESGKTAFLQALYRFNPARPNAAMSIREQYPAWLEKRDRQQGKRLESVTPILVVFQLEPADRQEVERVFGPKVLVTNELRLARSYEGECRYTPGTLFLEREAVQHLVGSIKHYRAIQEEARNITSFEALRRFASQLTSGPAEAAESVEAGKDLELAINAALGDKVFSVAAWGLLAKRIPRFFYFAEFAKLPYSVKIHEVLNADEKSLSDGLLTARSLLRLAGAESEYLLDPDYERRKRELENVANAITTDVHQFWSQNDRLRVTPDITQRQETAPDGTLRLSDELKLRIWDERHGLSLPFDQHSSGFQWFFSFLAAFSEFEYSDPPVIVLLDEPALGLHPRAQRDFLRFIDERVAKRCQVLYSTHSPFMVQTGKLERVRLVEDRGAQEGTKVTAEIAGADRDTLIPVQGALGYDLVQHLLRGPDSLLVEGASDFTYLTVISNFLKEQGGRTSLDERWSIVPVGSAGMIPAFVSLLGARLDATVLVHSQKDGHQRLSQLAADGYLARQRIVTVGEVIGHREADIEDLFDLNDYLMVFNAAFNTAVSSADLIGTDTVLARLARQQHVGRIDQQIPAAILLRRRDELLPKLSKQTLKRFETLFARLNETLEAAV